MFKFCFSTYKALTTHPYKRIKRNIQKQRNRGVQIQQTNLFENEDEFSDNKRKKNVKSNQSSSKRKNNDESNTSGTSRGKKTPAVPYGGHLVINTTDSDSEDEQSKMVPARAPPKTTSKGTGKGKGKGKSTQSEMWIDGRKNEEIPTNESDDRENDNTRENETRESVQIGIPGILDTSAMKRVFKVDDRSRKEEMVKENSEDKEKQKKYKKKKHKLGDKDVEMSEKKKKKKKKKHQNE